VTLAVEQGGRFGAYRLALPVDVVDARGARHRVTVAITADGSQSVALPGQYPEMPQSVTCDPDRTRLIVCTAK
jgi:hypothetical protein